MGELYFARPGKEHIEALQSYKEDFLAAENSMDGCGPLRRFDDINDYLKYTYDCEQKETCPEGIMPARQFLCIRRSDGEIIGMIQVRLELNDYLKNYAGHIGYSVRPSERRKGYATWMLHNIMPYCRDKGLNKIMVCCHENNTASRKTIFKNGGVLEGIAFHEPSSRNFEKYWIDLNEQESIETEHLRLRKARLADKDAIWKNVWSDQSIAERMLWQISTYEEAEDRIRRTMNLQSKFACYFVCDKATDEPIGFAGVKEIEPSVFEDAGVCLAAKVQHQGYGKEIIKALETLVFDLLEGKKFVWSAFSDNEASKRLALSAGFQYTGSKEEIREWDGFAYVADYYEKLREQCSNN